MSNVNHLLLLPFDPIKVASHSYSVSSPGDILSYSFSIPPGNKDSIASLLASEVHGLAFLREVLGAVLPSVSLKSLLNRLLNHFLDGVLF